MPDRTPASQHFPRSARLLRPAEFREVFADAQRVSDRHLTLLARANGLDHARIGLAISRRSVPRAVDRNRVKRIVRETFRQQLSRLPAVDVVIMARPDARSLDSAALHQTLDRLWSRLVKRCGAS